MKTNNLKIKSVFVICAMALTVFVSCEENNNPELPLPEVKKDFQLAFASGSASISGTYLQGFYIRNLSSRGKRS